MHFLIDADLPRSARLIIERYGHQATDIRDIGPASAPDSHVAATARRRRWCLISGDFGFADIRNYPPDDYAGIVVLGLPRDATASFIVRLIEDFLSQPDVVSRIGGKLAIVEPGRIRLRPASSDPTP